MTPPPADPTPLPPVPPALLLPVILVRGVQKVTPVHHQQGEGTRHPTFTTGKEKD